MANTPALTIGTTRQPFVDDHVIDRTEGVCRTLNQSAKNRVPHHEYWDIHRPVRQ